MYAEKPLFCFACQGSSLVPKHAGRKPSRSEVYVGEKPKALKDSGGRTVFFCWRDIHPQSLRQLLSSSPSSLLSQVSGDAWVPGSLREECRWSGREGRVTGVSRENHL